MRTTLAIFFSLVTFCSLGQTLVLETGNVTITHLTTSVTLTNTFTNPVVIAIPPTYNGANQATVKVDNVSSTGFDLRIEEPDNLDGSHTTETVHYIVVETGSFLFADGTIVEAGSVSSGTLGFQTVNLTGGFSGTPRIFTQVQTNNSSTNFIKTRQRNASSSSFQVKLERGENTNSVAPSSTETIGFLAVRNGVGNIGGVQIETGGFTFNNTNTTHTFASTFNAGNHIVTSIGTFNGGDPAGVRINSFSTTNVNLLLEEDTTDDTEIFHTNETLNYLVIDNGADAGVFLPALLPVELVNFEAEATKSRAVNLNWQTASESDNDYFKIQRSVDLESWEFIAKVDGAGNSTGLLQYSIQDLHPYEGVSYYQLVQVDFDGTLTLGPIRSVQLDFDQSEGLSMYPNPISKQLRITGMEEELKSIKLYNMEGREVEMNILATGNHTITVDFSTISSGVYFVKSSEKMYKVIKK